MLNRISKFTVLHSKFRAALYARKSDKKLEQIEILFSYEKIGNTDRVQLHKTLVKDPFSTRKVINYENALLRMLKKVHIDFRFSIHYVNIILIAWLSFMCRLFLVSETGDNHMFCNINQWLPNTLISMPRIYLYVTEVGF